jgi:radical SAM superfamily enzyme YgiQ (UPF0313 family)
MQMVPPGILSLSAYLKNHNIETDLFDTTFYKISPKSSDEERIDSCQVRPFNFADSGVQYINSNMQQDFYNKIESFQPQILAISCNDFTHNIAERLIKGIKQKYPNLFVIMGGIFPTFFPQHCIDNPDNDAVCIGEGYNALVEICNKYLNINEISKIKNLWVKYNNQIIKNPLCAPLDVRLIPSDDYMLFDIKRYMRPMQGKMFKMVPIWLDLGCPYSCTYCVAPGIRNKYKETGFNYCRVKPVNQIMNDIKNAQNLINPNYIYFSTETFFARSKQHIQDFAFEYKKNFNLPFWCETRIENINDFNCQILKDMGCNRLSIGLESGNEEYRVNILKKTFTNEQFLNAIIMLDKYGINLTLNSIIGFPDETREMIFDTINLLRKAIENKKIDITITTSTYVPCGGASLRQYCLDNNYFDENEYINMPLGSFHKGAYLKMPQISQDSIKGLLRCFPLYVKMPITLWNDIQGAENFDEYGNALFNGLRSIYWEKYFTAV